MKKSGAGRNSSGLIAIAIFIFLMLTAAVSVFGDSQLICFSCGDTITGKYVVTNDIQFHKSCFKCSECGKQISGPYNLEGKELYHPNCHKMSKDLVCNHCKKILDDKWIESDGLKYHNTCYKNSVQIRCDICKKPITGNYKKDDEGSYHKPCFNEHKLKKCVVCSQPIHSGYLSDIWGNNSHNKHNGSEPDLCSSCGRIISQKVSDGGFLLEDSRIICGICTKSSVTRSEQAKQLSSIVKKKLSTKGITIPNNIPIHLVNDNQLAEIAADMHTKGTKGLTNSKTVKRKDKIISVKHTIYILHSLPKVEFLGVLAHEYLHVWLNERQIYLTDAETEGFCNLGVLMINSSLSNPLAKNLQFNLENNPDPIYADGYRNMKAQLDTLGWKELLLNVSKK